MIISQVILRTTKSHSLNQNQKHKGKRFNKKRKSNKHQSQKHRLKKRKNKNKKRKNDDDDDKKEKQPPLTSEEVQDQIRNVGTYYLSFTDIDDRINLTEQEKIDMDPNHVKNATELFNASLKREKTKEEKELEKNGQTRPGELNLFNVPQIELPILCKEKLDLAH